MSPAAPRQPLPLLLLAACGLAGGFRVRAPEDIVVARPGDDIVDELDAMIEWQLGGPNDDLLGFVNFPGPMPSEWLPPANSATREVEVGGDYWPLCGDAPPGKSGGPPPARRGAGRGARRGAGRRTGRGSNRRRSVATEPADLAPAGPAAPAEGASGRALLPRPKSGNIEFAFLPRLVETALENFTTLLWHPLPAQEIALAGSEPSDRGVGPAQPPAESGRHGVALSAKASETSANSSIRSESPHEVGNDNATASRVEEALRFASVTRKTVLLTYSGVWIGNHLAWPNPMQPDTMPPTPGVLPKVLSFEVVLDELRLVIHGDAWITRTSVVPCLLPSADELISDTKVGILQVVTCGSWDFRQVGGRTHHSAVLRVGTYKYRKIA